MPLLIIRIIFLILGGVSGYIVVQNVSDDPSTMNAFQGIALGLGVPVVVIAVEGILRKYFVDVVAGIMFGITAGFLLSYIILQSLNLVAAEHLVVRHFQIPIILMVCYLTVAIVLQTKDKFKFIIPYLEFRSRGTAPDYLLLDSSSIIDGRIFRLLKMNLFPEKVVIPQFVLDELQTLSDSADKLKRERGKRALTTVQKIREDIFFSIDIMHDDFDNIQGVDAKIVALGLKVNGRIVTTDANLVKVAMIDGVPALNVNSLASAFRADVVAGDRLEVEIVKKGEEGKHQGVGYLEDGTMVVVEHSDDRLGSVLQVEVTNAMQTSSGRMIFGRIVS